MTDVTYSLKIVEMLQKLGQTEQALVAPSRGTSAACCKPGDRPGQTPDRKGEHAEIFYRPGKYLPQPEDIQRPSPPTAKPESCWSADAAVNYVSERSLGKPYLAMGDLFAGIDRILMRQDRKIQADCDMGVVMHGSAGAYRASVDPQSRGTHRTRKNCGLPRERIRLIGKNRAAATSANQHLPIIASAMIQSQLVTNRGRRGVLALETLISLSKLF